MRDLNKPAGIGTGPSPFWRNHTDPPAVLPDDPELDAIVDRILETGAPYPGSHAREWLADKLAPTTYTPAFSYFNAAISFGLGLLIGFAASAILL